MYIELKYQNNKYLLFNQQMNLLYEVNDLNEELKQYLSNISFNKVLIDLNLTQIFKEEVPKISISKLNKIYDAKLSKMYPNFKVVNSKIIKSYRWIYISYLIPIDLFNYVKSINHKIKLEINETKGLKKHYFLLINDYYLCLYKSKELLFIENSYNINKSIDKVIKTLYYFNFNSTLTVRNDSISISIDEILTKLNNEFSERCSINEA